METSIIRVKGDTYRIYGERVISLCLKKTVKLLVHREWTCIYVAVHLATAYTSESWGNAVGEILDVRARTFHTNVAHEAQTLGSVEFNYRK